MRPKVEPYELRYTLGIGDRTHSLEKYNFFLHNVSPSLTLEKLVQERLKEHPLVFVMDIGCGEANALKELKAKFKDRVHTCGVDLVKPGKMQGVDEFVHEDAFSAFLPHKQDIIVSFRSLHEIGHCEEMLKKLAECLAEGGVAVLSVRLQEDRHDSLICLGETTHDDVEFVVNLANLDHFEKCKVTVYGTMVPYVHGRFLAGATIVLEKE